MFDIVGVGDTNIDLIIKVDHLPTHDEKVKGILIGKYPGGIIGNFCSAASKFGVSTGIITKLGNDEFGNLCKADFIKRGIDIQGLIQDDKLETYFCVVHLDDSGEKALTIVETSAFLPEKSDINFSYLRKAKYVHMTTLDVDLANFVFGEIKNNECKLSLDIEVTASKAKYEVWNSLLSKLDIAFPNLAGLAALTETTDVDLGAKILLDHGVGMVVVTCGSQGARVYKEDYLFLCPAFPVDVKDTTGAGDCFNAVFLSCLSKHMPIEKAAKYASAAAAISIQTIGAREGLPTFDMVEKFLKNEENKP
ncbi:MAG TPA: hypothetical protein DDX29_03990 [Clostridiales bacterium]|nr:hypothetical protein [Clostridiales bacterium]